jgi:hypothetical protein
MVEYRWGTMAFQVADPLQELAIAVVHHAMLDANSGNKDAVEWLVSDHAVTWLDYVNMDGGFIESWIRNGCKMENTKALPRYRSCYDREREDE